MKRTLLVGALLSTLLPLTAQGRVEPRDGEEPIGPEPTVTIVDNTDSVLQIHQVNGQIYGIRVIPTKGEPYNLVDLNGDGKFIRNSTEKMLVPEWILISW